MSTLEKGSTILVTGVTGFVASHVAIQCLEAGYRVRGTVRDQFKAQWLHDLIDPQFGKEMFETVVVEDMIADGAFDEAVKGVSGVIHPASVMTFSDKVDEVIPPTIRGALNILTAANKEPGVKSLVYTSSSTAAVLPGCPYVSKITEDTWNDLILQLAYGPNPLAYVVYGASKCAAEMAFWKAVKETQPSFQVSAILPNANFGPILKPGAERTCSTASWITSIYEGKTDLFALPPQHFVDVRDNARLHLIALIDQECAGKRIFAFAAPYNWNDVLAIFRKQNPGKIFNKDIEGLGRCTIQVPNEESEKLLKKHYGRGWISLEESIKANTATLR